MSFHIFVVTYRVINFLPKLIHMLLFSTKKTEFPFLVFPNFRVMPSSREWRGVVLSGVTDLNVHTLVCGRLYSNIKLNYKFCQRRKKQ